MDKFVTAGLPRNKRKVKKISYSSSSISCFARKKKGKTGVSVSHAPRGQSQSYLDFGQKSFGKTAVCPHCQMFYVIGEIEDEANHLKHCQKHSQLNIDFLSVDTLRSDWELSNENGADNGISLAWEDLDNLHKIIKINLDHAAIRNKPKRSSCNWLAIIKIILDDIGAPDGTLDEMGADAFIYIDVSQAIVLGMVITEQLRSSDLFLFHPKATEDSTHNLPTSTSKNHNKPYSSNTLFHSKTTLSLFSDNYILHPLSDSTDANTLASYDCSPYSLGIKQMWVSAKYRRRGIAYKLLECVRSSAASNRIFPQFIGPQERHKIAFSQPTSDGIRFALKYVAPTQWLLVYSRSSVNTCTIDQNEKKLEFI